MAEAKSDLEARRSTLPHANVMASTKGPEFASTHANVERWEQARAGYRRVSQQSAYTCGAQDTWGRMLAAAVSPTPPAARSVPQAEVTFDITAYSVLKVSAQDNST